MTEGIIQKVLRKYRSNIGISVYLDLKQELIAEIDRLKGELADSILNGKRKSNYKILDIYTTKLIGDSQE